MRTRSIISVLRNRGTIRKTTKRMKHDEALNSIKSFFKDGWELIDIIDSESTPLLASSKGVCQLYDCNKKIRWEYTLKNTLTGQEVVAGSTCIWVLLEMSESQIKAFKYAEASIKAYQDMLVWKKDNKDVYNKLKALQKADIWFFYPFLQEIEYCRLNQEDTDYIRNLDLDHELQKQAEKNKKKSKFSKVLDKTNAETKAKTSAMEKDPKYKHTITMLKALLFTYPEDDFLLSAMAQIDSGRLLTDNQIQKIKALNNKEYYYKHIQGTEDDKLYSQCDKTIIQQFRQWVENKEIKIYFIDIRKVASKSGVPIVIKKYRKQINDEILKTQDEHLIKLWKFYRIKNEILLN